MSDSPGLDAVRRGMIIGATPLNKKFNPLDHGIDIAAPGGLTKLFALHRGTFGDAVMEDAGKSGDPKTGEPNTPKPGEGAKPDEKLGEPGLKALQAEREAKEAAERKAAELQKKLDKIDEEKLSEIDLAKKRAAEKDRENEELRLTNLRLTAIAEHSIPKDYQDLVHGKDEASFKASAEKVAKLAAAAAGKSKLPDPVGESGGENGGSGGNNSSGSVAAGRDRYLARKNGKK